MIFFFFNLFQWIDLARNMTFEMCYGVSTSKSATVHFLSTSTPGLSLNELILACPDIFFFSDKKICVVWQLLAFCCWSPAASLSLWFLLKKVEILAEKCPQCREVSDHLGQGSWEAEPEEKRGTPSLSQICPFKNPPEWGGGEIEHKVRSERALGFPWDSHLMNEW